MTNIKCYLTRELLLHDLTINQYHFYEIILYSSGDKICDDINKFEEYFFHLEKKERNL